MPWYISRDPHPAGPSVTHCNEQARFGSKVLCRVDYDSLLFSMVPVCRVQCFYETRSLAPLTYLRAMFLLLFSMSRCIHSLPRYTLRGGRAGVVSFYVGRCNILSMTFGSSVSSIIRCLLVYAISSEGIIFLGASGKGAEGWNRERRDDP